MIWHPTHRGDRPQMEAAVGDLNEKAEVEGKATRWAARDAPSSLWPYELVPVIDSHGNRTRYFCEGADRG